MTRKMAYRWHLRQLMATRGMFQTSDLVPLLAERGVRLSREQVYRLVTQTPQRMNMDVFTALCDILACGPSDLIEVVAEPTQIPKKAVAGEATNAGIGQLRPVRARIRRPDQGTD
ncbi:helix-turn-helix transcriptional regulator [Longispora sp. NPDC051575]|uniref:helix-turn-helix domain-containing protein n=1 Tax=Longispora sp. NPDC051575 TaxID=3154943 RepID=UPI0034475DC6